MNNAMVKLALEALRTDDSIAAFEAELQAKRDARQAFAESETFKRMLEAFKGQSEHISIDSEEASYFPDKVKAAAGWEFATEADIDHFFCVVADEGAPTVEQDSFSEDDDGSFDNSQFRHFGLNVFRMSGQGTFIRIHNR